MRSWPLFWNFDRNIVPAFLLRLAAAHDRIPASAVFPDKKFEMCGGWEDTIEFETEAGVTDAPSAARMKVSVSMERADKRARAQFLFVVTKRLVA
jgi:hypothetical protein